ncbi:MAG: DAK2 domain-containing protein [Clostridia bacterium]|nr:DAK2 domain-containing protein [Clostridia bacterium]
MNFIDASTLKSMLIAGANELSANVKIVNELNVFPVPDGDTGFNMLKTVEGGIIKIKDYEGDSVGELMSAFASGSLLGARGNSGVILSQMFKGMSNGLQGVQYATVAHLKNAFNEGVKCSYSAVQNPVEGTILTVFRMATEYTCANVSDDAPVEEFIKVHVEEASKVLVQTKEMLPVLKESDVVDSGGAGYVYVADGWLKMLTGEEVAVTFDAGEEETTSVDLSLFTSDSVLTYGYCTEFLLRLQKSKVDVDNFDEKVIVSELEALGGDSIVAFKTEDIVKIHVHIKTPGEVLNVCQRYGEFLTLKIENMTLQHNETKKKTPSKSVGVVAVASGDGFKEIFSDLGADVIVDGGQTSNPSTQDFISAFDEVNAKTILVLPNNSNVILTAMQSAKMYEGANIFVINTKTLQQGYVALSLINTGAEDFETHVSEIEEMLLDVVGIDVTYAVRNATVDGKSVKQGDFMGISGKSLLATAHNKVTAGIKAIKEVDSLDEKELLTVFIGADVTDEEREAFEEQVASEFPDLEYCPYDGGQDVYSFLICLE